MLVFLLLAGLGQKSKTKGKEGRILLFIRNHNTLQKDAETKMQKSVDSADNNLKGLRTGRAS